MSSSRSKGSRRSSSTPPSYQYPGLWCEWEWDLDKACWRRYRLKSPGEGYVEKGRTTLIPPPSDEYEYEYDPPQPSSLASTELSSATQLGTINELPAQNVQYQVSENYTTSPEVASLASNFSQLTTASAPTSSVPRSGLQSTPSPSTLTHIRTKNPLVDKEEFDPREPSTSFQNSSGGILC